MNIAVTCTAFEGQRHLATGSPVEVALVVKKAIDRSQGNQQILIFDDSSGRQIEFDLRGRDTDVIARFEQANPTPQEPDAAPRLAGRPKLGVVAREVTLLPRHWEWLAEQPGGASVTLRKLVEAARISGAGPDRVRQAREAADRFMATMLGNHPGYEEASRALYRGDEAAFRKIARRWPVDLRKHLLRLAADAFTKLPEKKPQ